MSSASRSLLTTLAIGGLLLACVRALRRPSGAAVSSHTPRTHREALHIWEGEGGGVPVTSSRTAAQVEPESKPQPAAMQSSSGYSPEGPSVH